MKKILFVVPLPPPTHGASFINSKIINNANIKNNFKIYFFNSSQSNTYSQLGLINLKKIILFLVNFFKLIKKIIFINPDLIYFNPSLEIIGFFQIFFIFFYSKF